MGNFFRRRTKAPTAADKWYYDENPFHASGVGMPNCTAYAWGRFFELTEMLTGERPRLSLDNAENWYITDDGYERGLEPKLGAVICWQMGNAWDSSDGAGHVGIVEAINADGSIVTSESGYQDERFWWTRTRYPGANWGGGSYTFQGFIYPPIDFEAFPAWLIAILRKQKRGALY